MVTTEIVGESAQGLEFERSVDVPPQDVFPAFTSALGLMEWLTHDARIDARPGGRLYLYWKSGHWVVGEFTALETDRRIALTWFGKGQPADTEVEVTLEPRSGSSTTRIRLVHSGLGQGEGWETTREQVRLGWVDALDNLVSVLQDGIDRRLFDRPMLGISSAVEVTDEVVKQRRLGVDHGMLLSDFVEGMGASVAGLQRGDVLVRLGDGEVRDWDSLAAAVGRYSAGDTVVVEYYRGAELRRADLTLLGRPRPRVPRTTGQAGEVLREVQSGLMRDLREAVAGQTEGALGLRPATGQWSALECLAHLLTTERSAQMWLTLLVRGEPLSYWAAEDETWIASALEVWPTSQALLYALEQAQAQTVAMVTSLPDSLLARRASYVGVCDMLFTSLPYHFQSHVAQIREAIEASVRLR